MNNTQPKNKRVLFLFFSRTQNGQATRCLIKKSNQYLNFFRKIIPLFSRGYVRYPFGIGAHDSMQTAQLPWQVFLDKKIFCFHRARLNEDMYWRNSQIVCNCQHKSSGHPGSRSFTSDQGHQIRIRATHYLRSILRCVTVLFHLVPKLTHQPGSCFSCGFGIFS